jgi:hypothetical protein
METPALRIVIVVLPVVPRWLMLYLLFFVFCYVLLGVFKYILLYRGVLVSMSAVL